MVLPRLFHIVSNWQEVKYNPTRMLIIAGTAVDKSDGISVMLKTTTTGVNPVGEGV